MSATAIPSSNRIDAAFARLRREGRKAFIPYIAAGVPGTAESIDLALMLGDLGADVLELGYPFSDPMADGVVNQAAATRALELGVTDDVYFDIVRGIRARSELPLVVFSYLNPIFRLGLRAFAQRAKEAGADGFLLVDMPVEEADEMLAVCKEFDLRFIFLAAPTTTPERLQKILEKGSGFLYYISRTGITGEQKGFQEGFEGKLGAIKKASHLHDLPVVVGFGVSTPEQVRSVCELCDGAVVGSALVRRTLEDKPWPEMRAGLETLAAALIAPAKEKRA
ncbi:MAG: tryptophan synthase alpha chain [Fibrobacteria bacterium]|nr:tryptophan synthase alpha chain [Fibrobacteria bacterium]